MNFINKLKELLRRLEFLKRQREFDQDLEEEMGFHLEMKIEENLDNGMSLEEARYAAQRQFGNSLLLREVSREMWKFITIETLIQDFRYGLRMLLKTPGFTIVAVFALALGIGANSAIFSVVNTVLLHPLPYKDPDRLMMVWEDSTKHGFPRDTPSVANYIDWRDQNQVFENMAAMAERSFNLTGVGEPERLDGRRVSASLFALLGVEPQLGRAFLPEEDSPGGNRVVMLSYGLWQRRFGADKNIIGRSLTLNGESYLVTGVMPQNFQFPNNDVALWVPISFNKDELTNRGSHYLQVIARTKPNISLQQVQAEMSTIGARLQQQYPDSNTDIGIEVVPLHEQLVGDIKPALLILLGSVGFVLLIACANVANLLLARAAVRQKEVAVRAALGASRLRLLRQFLTESILLATLGGLMGLLLSFLGVYLLKAFIPANISQAKAITIDAKVLAFTLLVSLLTGLLFGLAPATQASKVNLNDALKEGGRDSASGSQGNRIRGLLVVLEVAVSIILLIGAGLLINSFLRLCNVDPGFRAENLLTMQVVLPELKYADLVRRSAFYDELISRIETLPGVKSAAVINNLPLYRQGNSIGIIIEGRPEPPPGEQPIVTTRVISPNYFRTMSIELLQGRELTKQDTANSTMVTVISETMARRYWPGEDPIGKRISAGRSESGDNWITIIGVVKDVRQFELTADPKSQIYLSYQQTAFFYPRDLVVKTNVEPLSLASAVRNTVWEVDKDQPVSNIRTMETILSESIARQRFSMLLLGIFAIVALVLAAVGIYGVMSYSVAQRTREFGIRIALGAKRVDVLKLAVAESLKLVLIGIVIGLSAALILTRVMSSLLFGISATDPTTFITISLLIISVAILASFIPALRATKVDPMVALRYE